MRKVVTAPKTGLASFAVLRSLIAMFNTQHGDGPALTLPSLEVVCHASLGNERAARVTGKSTKANKDGDPPRCSYLFLNRLPPICSNTGNGLKPSYAF